MNDSPEQTMIARMELPPNGNAIVGRLFVLGFYAFVLVPAALAGYHLVHLKSTPLLSVVASVLWLSFVGLIVTGSVREDGVRQFLVNRLGDFSNRSFIEVVAQADQSQRICFGYVMFRRDFHDFEIEARALSSVEWSTGQATALAGEDMDDWHVTFWYHHPKGPQPRVFPGMRPDEPHCWGPSGSQGVIEAFGLSLVRFLQQAGIELEPTDDPTKFRSPSGSQSTSQV